MILSGKASHGKKVCRATRLPIELALHITCSGLIEELLSVSMRHQRETESQIPIGVEMMRDIQELQRVNTIRHDYRVRCGAFAVNFPENTMKVSDPSAKDPKIELSLSNMDTAAWNIVSEMMLSAGEKEMTAPLNAAD